jgi:hypothetical protein
MTTTAEVLEPAPLCEAETDFEQAVADVLALLATETTEETQ